MLATVNSRRRSVSRGPDDQAQGVVMEGRMGGAKKRRRCMFKRKMYASGWLLSIDFSTSFGRILSLHDAPDFGESGTAGKPIDTRFLRKPDFTLTVSGMDFSLSSALFLLGLRCTHSARELVDTHLLWFEGVRFVSGTVVTVPSDFLINGQVITDV